MSLRPQNPLMPQGIYWSHLRHRYVLDTGELEPFDPPGNNSTKEFIMKLYQCPECRMVGRAVLIHKNECSQTKEPELLQEFLAPDSLINRENTAKTAIEEDAP